MTTQADLPELPPLPNLQQQWQRQQITLQNQFGVQWTELKNFTSDEMRSYARAYGQACYAAGVMDGMERAAVICDRINSESGNGFEPFAAAIRAAKHTKQQTE